MKSLAARTVIIAIVVSVIIIKIVLSSSPHGAFVLFSKGSMNESNYLEEFSYIEEFIEDILKHGFHEVDSIMVHKKISSEYSNSIARVEGLESHWYHYSSNGHHKYILYGKANGSYNTLHLFEFNISVGMNSFRSVSEQYKEISNLISNTFPLRKPVR